MTPDLNNDEQRELLELLRWYKQNLIIEDIIKRSKEQARHKEIVMLLDGVG
jgi:hypothetical protein